MTSRPPATVVAVVLSLVTLLAGCGTRTRDAEVRAGAATSGAVALDQATVEQLRAAAGTQAAVVPAPAPDLLTPTAPMDFTVQDRSRSSGCVYLTVLGKQGWTAPNGTKPLCIGSKGIS